MTIDEIGAPPLGPGDWEWTYGGMRIPAPRAGYDPKFAEPVLAWGDRPSTAMAWGQAAEVRVAMGAGEVRLNGRLWRLDGLGWSLTKLRPRREAMGIWSALGGPEGGR